MASKLNINIGKSSKHLSVYALTYASIIVVFAVNIVIINLIDKEDYGYYAFIIAIIGLVEATVVVRGGELYLKIVGQKCQNKEYARAISITKLLIQKDLFLYIITYILLCGLAELLSIAGAISRPELIAIAALSIPLQTGKGIYKTHLVLIDRINQQSYIEMYQSIWYAAITISLTLAFGLSGLISSLPVITLIRTLSFRYVYRQQLKIQNIDWRVHNIEKQVEGSLKYSAISMLRSAQLNGISQIDILVIGMLSTPEAVASLKVAKLLAGLPTKITIPIWKIQSSIIIRSTLANDHKALKQSVQKGLIQSIIALVAVLGISYLVGNQAILRVFGYEYHDVYDIYVFVLLSYGIYFSVNGWLKHWSVACNKQLLVIIYYSLGLVLTLALALLLHRDLVQYSRMQALGFAIIGLFALILFFYNIRKVRNKRPVC
jgi:O-antigen/teichoic acid export membrane protein